MVLGWSGGCMAPCMWAAPKAMGQGCSHIPLALAMGFSTCPGVTVMGMHMGQCHAKSPL